MGAEVLVATLRLDLCRIDLSRVMAPRIAAAGAVFYPNASRAHRQPRGPVGFSWPCHGTAPPLVQPDSMDVILHIGSKSGPMAAFEPMPMSCKTDLSPTGHPKLDQFGGSQPAQGMRSHADTDSREFPPPYPATWSRRSDQSAGADELSNGRATGLN
jgi:hypothetical protein